MGGPITSAIVGGLVKCIGEKLGTAAFKELGLVYGAEDELRRLGNTLTSITAVIHDAEQHPAALASRSERNWIRKLTDAAYDLDDAINLAIAEDLQHKVRGRSALCQKVTGLIIKRRYSLAQVLKPIRRKLEEILADQQYVTHTFQQIPLALPTPPPDHTEFQTDHFVNEIDVVGRNEDKEWIVSRLISASSQETTQVQALPIVGLGGMGKTTLARLVFNDPTLVRSFELLMWAYAPNKFEIRSVIHHILQSTTAESFSHLNMEQMKTRLHAAIGNKKFLLVLDNVWVQDVIQWSELQEILDAGAGGSKVLVTTREDRVASVIGAMETYRLKPLPDHHCLSIFLKFAFTQGEQLRHPALVEIAKELVRKCCGVPLVAKTLGSQLRTNRDEPSWKRILKSELWKMEQPDRGILPALRLSYHQMPPNVRLAFSLCSVLRKGQVVSRGLFVMLLMSLAPLESSSSANEDLQDIANRYFNELVSRSIFQEVHPYHRMVHLRARDANISEVALTSTMRKSAQVLQDEPRYGKVENAQMHDLINDLARYVGDEETAFVSCAQPGDVSPRSRYLVWEEEDLSEREFPSHLLAAKNARLLMMSGIRARGSMTPSFLRSLISNFRLLRVLVLDYFEFEKLPDSIGSLKLLRDLILSGNRKLKGFPNSICKLVNLQLLDVIDCEELEQIPKDLNNWLSLRHLLFTSKLRCFGKINFHGWTALHELRIACCMELESLPEQIGTLATLRILRIVTLPELTSLPNSISHLVALEELRIIECPMLDLRGWEGMRGLRSLRHLQFGKLPLLEQFPDGLQNVNASLRYLVVKECNELKELPESLEHCTSLEKLTLYMCPSLFALPNAIQAITSLQVLWIALCDNLLPRCARETGEDWHLISHIASIKTISLP